MVEYYTVGPVEMYPHTLQISAQQVPYFRTDAFSDIVLSAEAALKRLVCAPMDARAVFLTASGTAAMEATVMNCFDDQDRVLIVDGGTFGHRFVQLAALHQVPHDVVHLDYGEVLTERHLEEALRPETSGVLINHHETSTGQLYDLPMVAEFARAHQLLFVVDAISSFLADPLSLSAMDIDALIVSSQKALALAPGLSSVVLSSRIMNQRVSKIKAKTMYLDFASALQDGQRGQTPFTPAVGIVLELQDMLRTVEEQGLDAKIRYTKDLATDFRNRASAIGLKTPHYPLSNALTPVMFPRANAMEVFRWLIDEHGIYLNPTGGELASSVLRVAHIGNHSPQGNARLIDLLSSVI